MRVRDLMRPCPLTVRAEDDIEVAAQAMLWLGVRHLPVMNGDRLAGIVSERDLARHGGHGKPAAGDATTFPSPIARQIASIMSTPPQHIHPDDSITEAAERMAAHKIGCLPVLEKGALIGILTTTDLLALRVREAYPRPKPEDAAPLLAREIMTPDPVRTTLDEFVVNAIILMGSNGVRHLPVVDPRGHFVGMLSDRDVHIRERDFIGGAEALRDCPLRVESLVCRAVPTVGPDAPLGELVPMFCDWRLSALAVVDAERRLVGVISYVDVLRALAERAGRPGERAPRGRAETEARS